MIQVTALSMSLVAVLYNTLYNVGLQFHEALSCVLAACLKALPMIQVALK